jgi:hypothetical protein
VRHAREDDLGPVADLLVALRAVDGLTERKPGTFYRGSSAFLHFHVDTAGMFADLKVDGAFQRARVTTKREQARFLAVARRAAARRGLR